MEREGAVIIRKAAVLSLTCRVKVRSSQHKSKDCRGAPSQNVQKGYFAFVFAYGTFSFVTMCSKIYTFLVFWYCSYSLMTRIEKCSEPSSSFPTYCDLHQALVAPWSNMSRRRQIYPIEEGFLLRELVRSRPGSGAESCPKDVPALSNQRQAKK